MRVSGSSLKTSLGLLTGLTLLEGLPAYGQAVDSSLSFFITGSAIGQGGNLGGLSGADAHCQKLADSVGAGGKTWHAYLSLQAVGGATAVNARDRIGTGPWFNANKVKIASNVEELHGTNNLTAATNVTHRGAVVASGRHDIMTGSRIDGTAPAPGADSTCANWTSSSTGRTIVGHSNRMGIASNISPTSWNQAHTTTGCTQANVEAGGGYGFFYCFASDAGSTGVQSRRSDEGNGPVAGQALYYLAAGHYTAEVVYRFALERESRVEVVVLDLGGRERASLLRALRPAGVQEVRWDGRDAGGAPLSPGMYRIVFRRDGEIRAR